MQRPYTARRAPGPFVAAQLCVVVVLGCETGASVCEPDLEALAAEPLCVADDDCPCGGHCDLGICLAVCTADADCADGQRCDGAGRCRAASDPSELPPLPEQALGALQLVPSVVYMAIPGQAQRVDVDVLGGAVDRARLVAGDDQVEVSCTGSEGPFARYCELTSLAAGHHPTYVRLVGAMPLEGATYSVSVHSATDHSYASVQVDAPVTMDYDPALAGVYGGTATLVQHGIDAELTDVSGVALALDAELYAVGPTALRLAVEDPEHVFGPEDRWVVALDQSDASWTARAPALRAGERLVRPTFEAAGVANGVVELAFELETIGLTYEAAAVQRWTLHLVRLGDPTDGAAPEVPAEQSIDLPALATRQNTMPLRWAVPAAVRELTACGGAPLSDPSGCAQQHLCWEWDSAEPSLEAGLLDRELANDASWIDEVTTWGDLRCDAGSRSAALEYFDSAEDPTVTARVLLESCADDLERYWGPVPTPAPTARGLHALSTGVQGCLDARRFDAALDAALTSARARASDPTRITDQRATTLATRLLYQWAQIHGFLASEALDSDTLVAVTGAPGDGNERTLDGYLELSLEGWELVLHPRVVHGLLGVPEGQWGIADYREHFINAPLPATPPLHHEQGMGLPVAFARTLSSQLEVARALIARARFAGTGAEPALALARRSTHAAAQVLALADVIAERALSPGWRERYDAARRGALNELTALHREVWALRRGENPLGIRPSDLPLTFAGDPTEPASRFSAVSDFLVGSTLSSSAWAPAAVDRAEISLQAARDEWVAQRTRELGAVMNATETESRLAALRGRYDQQLSTLCGDDEVSLASWDPTSAPCFLDPAPRCSGTRAAFTGEGAEGNLALPDIELLRCHMRAAHAIEATPMAGDGNRAEINRALRGDDPAELDDDHVSIGSTRFPVSVLFSIVIPSGEVSGACAAEHPGGRYPLPQSEIDPSCVRGGIGEAFLDVHRAQQALELARVELASFEQRFDIATRSCELQTDSAISLGNLEAARLGVLTGLRTAKLGCDIIANTTRTLATTAKPAEFLFGGGGSIVLANTAMLFESVSMGLQFAIETASDEFDRQIAQEERLAAVRICYNDARSNLVGAEAAGLRADNALFELKASVQNLLRLYASVASLVEEGRAAVALEEARVARVDGARAPLANARWLGQTVDTFRRDMRLAQRVTFLATRAVRYELQADVAHLEAAVLAAQRPDELRAVIDELLTITANRGVAGRSPSQLVTVFSMRDQLYQLAERGGRAAPERFADLFEPAIDETGRRGYRVPFSLLPQSGGDVSGAVQLFASTDCAERVWSVAASVQGSDLHVGGDPPSFVRLDLLKSNTFASQWCDGRDELQVASFEPGRNLFADPVHGTAVGTSAGMSASEGFTRSRMRAFFGVERGELERDEYTEGASPELAGRGLYGDYALFFPEEVISRAGGPGLSLDAIEDIVLRFEYVSVAR